jgi:hypothetical protein
MYAEGPVLGDALRAAVSLGADFPTSGRDAFNRVATKLLQGVNKFLARRRALPIMEAQVRGIGVYAVSLPPGPARQRLSEEYAKQLADVERMKWQADTIVRDAKIAMGWYRDAARRFGIPGGDSPMLGGLGIVIPLAVPVIVVSVSAALVAWAIYFDQKAKTLAEIVKYARDQHLTPKQLVDLNAKLQAEGANTNPKALAEFFTGLSTAIVVGILALALLPTLLRSARQRAAA